MNGERMCLAVDLGTSGLKVGLVSFAGRVCWSEQVALRTVRRPDGTAEQDAEGWWSAVVEAARRAVSAIDPGGRRVDAVGLTGQWASTVAVDERGRPLAGCVMWMDTRGGRHARRAFGGPIAGYSPLAAASWIRRNGVPPALAGDDSLGHFLHLERDRPAVARAARWYLEPVDYLAMRLCGVAAATPASMAASWLVDTRRGQAAYDPILVRRSGIDPAKLPPLHPTGSVVAGVLPEIAAVLDIRPGTPVVAGVPDLHSAAAGAGTVEDYQAHLTISTTSWISCPLPGKKTDPIHQLATVPGLTPDGYLLVDNQDNAGRCVEWFREALAGPITFEELFALAGTATPGSGGVIFAPWLNGERSPVADRAARGGFHHLGLGTGRAELARAVLEGVAMNSRWLLGAVERFCRRRLEPIRLLGGGARSQLWCQIFADVLDRRIEQVADPLYANLRGAALLAGVAVGSLRLADLPSLVDIERELQPDPASRVVHDRQAAELPRLYRAQRGLSARLDEPGG